MAYTYPYERVLDPLVIPAGYLRHEVVFQAPGSVRDDAGELVSASWNSYLTTLAGIDSTMSQAYRESFTSDAFSSQSTDLFTIRWPGSNIDIEPGHRILFRGDYYLVQGIDNVRKRDRVLRIATLVIDGGSA